MLSVLLTTRDRAPSLATTLDALGRLASPPGGFEVVVADDGSRDETPAVLGAPGRPFPLRVVRAPRAGQNATRNRALGLARGAWVVFTDDDARPHPDWLVRLHDAMEAHPEVDVVAGTVRPDFEVMPPAWVLRAVRPGPMFAWVERPASGPVDPTEAVGPAFAVRAARFAAGLRFDETIGPDGGDDYAMGAETELLLRLRAAGARAWYAREAVVEHHVAASHATETALLRRAYRYGRGRFRLGTSRLARTRLRWRGVPLATWADLWARARSWRRARRRGDDEGALRAAWRLAYLAGHVAEARHAREGRARLGLALRLVPAPLRAAVTPSAPARTPAPDALVPETAPTA